MLQVVVKIKLYKQLKRNSENCHDSWIYRFLLGQTLLKKVIYVIIWVNMNIGKTSLLVLWYFGQGSKKY